MDNKKRLEILEQAIELLQAIRSDMVLGSVVKDTTRPCSSVVPPCDGTMFKFITDNGDVLWKCSTCEFMEIV